MDHAVGRRRFVLTAAGGVAVALAGCLGDDDDEPESSPTPEGGDDLPPLPRIEDPPDQVYLPTHRETMAMTEPRTSGEYAAVLSWTYPHQFWVVTGSDTQAVEPSASDDLHLMVTVWDDETGTVLPTESGQHIEVLRDGEFVTERAPWPMISQSMGFHFGDNFQLDGDGTYTARVEIPPPDVRRLGAFEGRLEEGTTVEFEFEFTDERRRELRDGITWLDEDDWGEPGALAPMGEPPRHTSASGHDHDDHGDGDDPDEHGGDGHEDGHDDEAGDDDYDGHDHDHGHVPYSALSPVDDLPGTVLGTPESHDAVLATTLIDPEEGLGPSPYLAVSPRTPYNRSVLPAMGVAATQRRDGEEVAATDLTATLHEDLDLHFGAAFEDVRPGDEFVLAPTPPQVSRHQGYDTAFLEMPAVEVVVE